MKITREKDQNKTQLSAKPTIIVITVVITIIIITSNDGQPSHFHFIIWFVAIKQKTGFEYYCQWIGEK